MFRRHWVILRTCIAERLVYRGDFALVTLFRFLPIVTQIFLWGAIFQGTTKTIKGYRYGDMVAYFMLTMLTRAFSSMPGLATGIAREIRDGSIKKYLTQPIDMLSWLFWHRVAHKLVYYTVAAGPFALVFWLGRGYFSGWPDGWTIAGFLISLPLSFLIGFLMESLLGMIGFWFLEVGSLMFIYMMISYFLSGHMLPLDLLPSWASLAVELMPFKYLAYVPCVMILGRLDHQQMSHELTVAVLWVVGLFIANRIVFHLGLRRYSAYGG